MMVSSSGALQLSILAKLEIACTQISTYRIVLQTRHAGQLSSRLIQEEQLDTGRDSTKGIQLYGSSAAADWCSCCRWYPSSHAAFFCMLKLQVFYCRYCGIHFVLAERHNLLV